MYKAGFSNGLVVGNVRVLYGCTAAGLVRPYSGGCCTVVQVSTTVWLSCYKPMWKILKRCGKDAVEAYEQTMQERRAIATASLPGRAFSAQLATNRRGEFLASGTADTHRLPI